MHHTQVNGNFTTNSSGIDIHALLLLRALLLGNHGINKYVSLKLAQGRTLTEALEIARDVAKKLLEAQTERHQQSSLTTIQDSLILGR